MNIEKIVKCLEMMGYRVSVNVTHGILYVSLTTNSKFITTYSVHFNALQEDMIIPHIVRTINKQIVENL